MWDWELLKKQQTSEQPNILCSYQNEAFHYCCARSFEGPEDEFLTHNHAMYELVFGVSGSAVYRVEGESYTVEKNTLLLIGPTVLHKLSIPGDAQFERHTVYIHCAGISSTASHLVAQCCRQSGINVSSAFFAGSDLEEVRMLFDTVAHAAASPDETVRGLVPHFMDAMLSRLLMLSLEKHPVRIGVSNTKTVDKLTSYLSRHFTENLTLEEIADRFSISKDYCSRLFRKATGFSVKQYILYHRVLYARQLLSENHTAAETAKLVGFQSYTSFYRAYHQITGHSPMDDLEWQDEE